MKEEKFQLVTKKTILASLISALTLVPGGASLSAAGGPPSEMFYPFGLADFFAVSNYLYSPLPEICDGVNATLNCQANPLLAGSLAGGLHKFVDTLTPLGCDATAPTRGDLSATFAPGTKNTLGQCIPVAVPDQTTYPAVSPGASTKYTPAADYYSLEIGQYYQQMHSELPQTFLQGYRQKKTANQTVATVDEDFHYLGPFVVAARGRPVRLKVFNAKKDPVHLPVDEAFWGAGDVQMTGGPLELASKKRSSIHLHGGDTGWISDGTPHQWFTPTNDAASNTLGYSKGTSFMNVPDMVNSAIDTTWWYRGTGNCTASPTSECVANTLTDAYATFYYPNGQTSRLEWYHDHVFGLTRLNVYQGEAAPYLLADKRQEDSLHAMGVPGWIGVDQIALNGTSMNGWPEIPPGSEGQSVFQEYKVNLSNSDLAHIVPLIIQDKTFVPDNGEVGGQTALQDPTWPSPCNASMTTTNRDAYGTPLSYTGSTPTSAPYWNNSAVTNPNPGLSSLDCNPLGLTTTLAWSHNLNAASSGWGKGSLYLPHVYMTNQLPFAVDTGYSTVPTTVAGLGRWDFTPWMGAPLQVNNPPVNCDTAAYAQKPFQCPAMKNPTAAPESFMDTPVVNGVAYPRLNIAGDAYRFKVLNASDDRFYNLGLYYAVTQDPIVSIVDPSGAGIGAAGHVQVSGGQASVIMDSLGSGYGPNTVISVNYGVKSGSYSYSPAVFNVGAGGINLDAAGQITYVGTATSPASLASKVSSSGTGFDPLGSTPVVSITDVVPGGGSGAFAHAVINGDSSVSVVLDAPGSAYTSAASITVTQGAATATFTVSSSEIQKNNLGELTYVGTPVVPGQLATGGGNFVAGGQQCKDVATNLVPLCTEVAQLWPTASPVDSAGNPIQTCSTPIIKDGLGLYHVSSDIAMSTPFGYPQNCWPSSWPTDGRAHGSMVPDPRNAGPIMVQLGNEGGLLPNPVFIPSSPMSFVYDRKVATIMGFTAGHGLNLAPAQRADLMIDFFTARPASGQSVFILYNDQPAPAPLFDTRYDMYTNDPDNSGAGGAPTTLPGYGPNTRTLMQIVVNSSGTQTAQVDLNALASTSTGIPALFATTQDRIVVDGPQYPAGNGQSPNHFAPVMSTVSVPDSSSDKIGSIVMDAATSLLKWHDVPTVALSTPVDPGTLQPVAAPTPGGATATAVLAPAPLTGFAVTGPGAGYTSAPAVTVGGGIGAGATATSTLVPSALNPSAGIAYSVLGSYTAAPNTICQGANCLTNPTTPIPTDLGVASVSLGTAPYYPAGTAGTVTFPSGTGISPVAAAGSLSMPTANGGGILGFRSAAATCIGAQVNNVGTYGATSGAFTTGARPAGAPAVVTATGTALYRTVAGARTLAAVNMNNPGNYYAAAGTTVRIPRCTAGGGAGTNIPPINAAGLVVGYKATAAITDTGSGYVSQNQALLSSTQPGTMSVSATNNPLCLSVYAIGGGNAVTGPTQNCANANAPSALAATGTLGTIVPTSGIQANLNTWFPSTYTGPVSFTISGSCNGPCTTFTAQITPTSVSSVSLVGAGGSYRGLPSVTIGAPQTQGTQATAIALRTATAIQSFTINSSGSGYKNELYVPLEPSVAGSDSHQVGGGDAIAYATASTSTQIPLDWKGIIEGFDPMWGTLNVELADSIPVVAAGQQNQAFLLAAAMPFGYVDPPSELLPNGSTDAWRIDHIGVDAHAVHFHLFNLQVLGYVDIAGQIYTPDSNQDGWNETLRTEPFTSVYVAMKPKQMYLPWSLPNSIRIMDPTTPAGTQDGPNACINNPFALQPLLGPTCVPFTLVDPTGNAVNITNEVVNYGSEYVYHCHLLGHEEHDMMRPMSFVVNPDGAPTLAINGTNFRITDNSVNETQFTIQRSVNNGAWVNWSTVQSPQGARKGNMLNVPLPAVGGARYRAVAENVVGCNPNVPNLAQSNSTTMTGGVSSGANANQLPNVSTCSDVFTGWPTLKGISPPSATVVR